MKGFQSLKKKYFAFTLAEVLITLGVIGVVASMTIPALIQDYRKSVVANKLKKTASTLQQAYISASADFGKFEVNDSFEENNPDEALRVFETYYKPYMKLLKVEKGTKGAFAYMTDGTVLYFRRTQGGTAWQNAGIYICMNEKACKNINEDAPLYEHISSEVDGRNVFRLSNNGIVTKKFKSFQHDELVTMCKEKTHADACTMLIFEAGWKVPKDYPVRL